MKIPVKPKKDLKTSAYTFDKPFLRAGQEAHITNVCVADAQNPLYEVTRTEDGVAQAVYRRQLVEVGALDEYE